MSKDNKNRSLADCLETNFDAMIETVKIMRREAGFASGIGNVFCNVGRAYTDEELLGALEMLRDILHKPFSQIDAENGVDGVGVQIEAEQLQWICIHGMRNTSDNPDETIYIIDDEHPDIYTVFGRKGKDDSECVMLCDFLTNNLAQQFANYLCRTYDVNKWCHCVDPILEGIAQAIDAELSGDKI